MRAACLICAGADDDDGFDYCRCCGRVGNPMPFGASSSVPPKDDASARPTEPREAIETQPLRMEKAP